MSAHPSVVTRKPGAVLVLALAATLLTTACAVAVSPINLEAAHTAARVKTALVNDPEIGTLFINVQMLGSVAQLSGRVRTQEEAARAADVTRGVAGVSDVESRLQIGGEPAEEEPAAQPISGVIRGPAAAFAELRHQPNLLALGAGIGLVNQGPSVGTRVYIHPVVRFGGGSTGLAPAVAFEWFDAQAVTASSNRAEAGDLRVRPIMAGVGYTIPVGRLAFTTSLLGGYAFNSIRLPAEGDAAGLPVSVDNSFVWRPGVALWFDSGRRTLMHASIGRALTSPGITVIENGQLRKRSVSADTTVVRVGVAYRLF